MNKSKFELVYEHVKKRQQHNFTSTNDEFDSIFINRESIILETIANKFSSDFLSRFRGYVVFKNLEFSELIYGYPKYVSFSDIRYINRILKPLGLICSYVDLREEDDMIYYKIWIEKRNRLYNWSLLLLAGICFLMLIFHIFIK
ncbi:hypothetical protein G7084_00470 [Weissella coleopterorum]|uniref:Uncharacterized protein n=1 Tax=Weissella coleopterorum TaxID=2714949 RepID=A0A6G8AYA2_9LACO|nr:hypothetical protein [Weissella coleopterorum]QIL49932.1 hypothetical protein G7084_00470 [Weissella coleopterorum]